jgi:hypothetical protein
MQHALHWPTTALRLDTLAGNLRRERRIPMKPSPLLVSVSI